MYNTVHTLGENMMKKTSVVKLKGRDWRETSNKDIEV